MKKVNRIEPLSRAEQTIWLVCRVLLFVWGVLGLFFGYTVQFVQAIFAIIFTYLWDMWQLWGGKSFITRVPSYLQTELNIFICFGCVVGTTVNNYTSLQGIDIPEHIFAGFLGCTFGFILCDVMQGEKRKIKPAVQALFGLGFGVALMVGWEFYEFTMDRLYGFDMQHSAVFAKDGLADTMIDLILGSAGSLAAMFVEVFRRTGRYGKNSTEKRKAYLRMKAETQAEKEALYEEKQKRFNTFK